MNWKKGFRRIAFVSAIFIAFICAGLCVVLVLLIHSEAQSNLNWKKDSYSQNYETQQIAESSNLTEAEQQELAFLEAKKTQSGSHHNKCAKRLCITSRILAI